jgi:hypothetical protein
MKINWRRVWKREAFFLKTGQLSRKRDLVKPGRKYFRPQQVIKASPDTGKTKTECKVEPVTLGQSDLNLLVEAPLSAKLEALRR